MSKGVVVNIQKQLKSSGTKVIYENRNGIKKEIMVEEVDRKKKVIDNYFAPPTDEIDEDVEHLYIASRADESKKKNNIAWLLPGLFGK